MNRGYAASSNLQSVGYDEPSQTLEIEFRSGGIYRYFNVPMNLYRELMRAPSKGGFLHQYIKNAFPYSRVG
ncbi:MAG: KTSC domain-containing protein [Gammaproteobacteria bacterium]|nr:KTSC domain-containing protein [Gammaproteobacteria bacterium]